MNKIYTIAVAFLFIVVGCREGGNQTAENTTTQNETSMEETVASGGIADESESDSLSTPSPTEWAADKGLEEVTVPEFEGADIKYYKGNGYSVYSIAKELLFTTGSAGFRSGSEQSLRKISSAIARRDNEGQVQIYGYIDASENPNYKRDVAERRIQAIEQWLETQANIDADRVTVKPVVEITPAVGETDLMKEHRIEIVVKDING